MSLGQMIIFVMFSAFTGWLISWFTIKILFFPVAPINFCIFTLQGIIPAARERFTEKIAQYISSEFISFRGIDDKISDPALLDKLKPEIENHVDYFLNNKLSTVFPLLYSFMGEKTLLQFKKAFLDEIDILFPTLIKNYTTELKKEISLDKWVSAKIKSIPIKSIRVGFYENAKKEMLLFKLICTGIGLLMGIIGVLIMQLMHF